MLAQEDAEEEGGAQPPPDPTEEPGTSAGGSPFSPEGWCGCLCPGSRVKEAACSAKPDRSPASATQPAATSP